MAENKDKAQSELKEKVVSQQVDNQTTEVEEERSKYVVIPELLITRKLDVRSGKKYYSYYVHGLLRGVEVKVRVRPGKDDSGFTDVNVYTLLDIVFGTGDEAAFAVQILKRKDFSNNRTMKSLQYYAYVFDKTENDEYVAPLRFETSGDKAVMLQLLEKVNRKYSLDLPL